MILLGAFVASLAVAWALGAPLGRLAELKFRGESLVFAALAIQIVLFTPLGRAFPGAAVRPGHIASYVAIIAFLALNVRRPGIWLIAAGALSNTLVIAINGGVMPVSLGAWRASGRAADLVEHARRYNNTAGATAHSHLAFLGDIFPLPRGIPFAEAISIGDVLIILGMTAFVYRACVRTEGLPPHRVFLPLRVSAYRHVLLGRLCSSLGDWIAMVAVVTWVYDHSRSTVAVSVFMVLRIVATTIGGALSAPILNRMQGFRALTTVEAGRGLLSVGVLLAAVTSDLAVVVVLVCLSSLLGAATNPSARSIIPEVLPEAQVHAGNALHGVARNLTMVLGTAVAAFTTTRFGITSALLIDIGSFAGAAALYYRFRNMAYAPEPASGEVASRRALLGWLVRDRVAFALTASFAVATAGIGLFNTTLPAFLADRLASPGSYGYALAMIGAGLMVGEFLTAFISRDTLVRRSIPIAFTAFAGILLFLAATGSGTTAYLLLFFLGANDGTTEVVYDTLMQRATPSSMRAGVFAIASSISNAGMALGFVAAAVLAVAVPPQAATIVAGAACLLAVPLTLPILTPRLWPLRLAARRPADPARSSSS
jgi:predicted MFS family arabinose efflux permease